MMWTTFRNRHQLNPFTIYAKWIIRQVRRVSLFIDKPPQKKLPPKQPAIKLSTASTKSFCSSTKLMQVKGTKNRQHLSFPIYLITVRMNKCYSTCSLSSPSSLPNLWGQIGISPVTDEIGCITEINLFSKCQLSERNMFTVQRSHCAKIYAWCSECLRCNFGKQPHFDSQDKRPSEAALLIQEMDLPVMVDEGKTVSGATDNVKTERERERGKTS